MIVIISGHIRGIVSDEETMWSRLEKNIANSKSIGIAGLERPLEQELDEIKPELVIQNSTLGKLSDYKTISFLQDPFIAMKKHFDTPLIRLKAKVRKRKSISDKLKDQIASFQNSIKVTNSAYMADLYSEYGEFKIIPMGVDHDLFKPMNKSELRKKYGIPKDKTVKIFVGSRHPVKGFNAIKEIIQAERNAAFWILVLKDAPMSDGHNYRAFHRISQNVLAELYNCSDLMVSRSITESFGLAMVEAMFCDVPVDSTKTGVFWDWEPDFEHPRKAALEHKLDKDSWMSRWNQFIRQC